MRWLALIVLLGCEPIGPEPVDGGARDAEVCSLADRCVSIEERCRDLAVEFDWLDYGDCVDGGLP